MSYSHQPSMRLFFTFVLFLYAQITEGIGEFGLPSSFVAFMATKVYFILNVKKEWKRKKNQGIMYLYHKSFRQF